jgi:hypothetical protein
MSRCIRLITSARVTTLPVLRQKLGRLAYLSRTDDAPSTPSAWHNFLIRAPIPIEDRSNQPVTMAQWTPPEGSLEAALESRGGTADGNVEILTQPGLDPTPLQLPPAGDRGHMLPLFEWDRAQLSTSRMPLGSSSRWTTSNDKIRVDFSAVSSPARLEVPTPGSNIGFTRLMRSVPVNNDVATDPAIYPSAPTAKMIELGVYFRRLPPEKLRHSDLVSFKSSDGISVLVALFLEDLGKDLATRPPGFMYKVAHSLLTSAVGSLLAYFKNRARLETVLSESDLDSEGSMPNILREGDLCPALFPRLIRKSTLIQRRFEVDLSHADCMRIISPFMHRFYPMSALRTIRSIQSLPVSELVEIVQKPGYFAALWWNTEEQCVFDPPRWIDLSLTVASGTTLQSPPITTVESQLTLDGFSPMTSLGLSQEEVRALLSDSLHTRSLQYLPQSLNAFLPPEETAQVIISIATSSTEGLPHLLSPDGFRACLNKLRVSAHPTPPTWTMRIRLHVNKTVQSWDTYESMAFA